MSKQFSKPVAGARLIICIFLASGLMKFTGLVRWMYFFGDQAWYFFSARESLTAGVFPMLGITSSITWLHQGPLWTYLMIPVLGLFKYSPVAATLFTGGLNLFVVPLAYYLGTKLRSHNVGVAYAGIMGLWYFSVIHSRIAYHTSLIPLFFIIFSLLLVTGRYFLGGLFLGFLYQSHLLTFIFWPLVFIFHPRGKLPEMSHISVGFLLGILPFILSGPIQTGGIFIWLLSRIFIGFSSVGLLSQAYLVVLMAPVALVVSLVFEKIHPKILWILTILFFIINYSLLLRNGYSLYSGTQLYYPQKLKLAGQIFSQTSVSNPEIITFGPGQEFASNRMPYTFLVWRKAFLGETPSGTHTSFIVDETHSLVRVLE